MTRTTLKDLQGYVDMIKADAIRKNRMIYGGRYHIADIRIQSGPAGKRIVIQNYEVTQFMPASELRIYLIGFWNGLQMSAD